MNPVISTITPNDEDKVYNRVASQTLDHKIDEIWAICKSFTDSSSNGQAARIMELVDELEPRPWEQMEEMMRDERKQRNYLIREERKQQDYLNREERNQREYCISTGERFSHINISLGSSKNNNNSINSGDVSKSNSISTSTSASTSTSTSASTSTSTSASTSTSTSTSITKKCGYTRTRLSILTNLVTLLKRTEPYHSMVHPSSFTFPINPLAADGSSFEGHSLRTRGIDLSLLYFNEPTGNHHGKWPGTNAAIINVINRYQQLITGAVVQCVQCQRLCIVQEHQPRGKLNISASSLLEVSITCKNLQMLSLANTGVMQDVEIVETGEYMSATTYVVPSYFTQRLITPAMAIQKILENCEKMVYLNLYQCEWVNCETVSTIIKYGGGLMGVNLGGCGGLPAGWAKLYVGRGCVDRIGQVHQQQPQQQVPDGDGEDVGFLSMGFQFELGFGERMVNEVRMRIRARRNLTATNSNPNIIGPVMNNH